MKKIAENKKAYHDYFIEDKLECGIQLTGNEIKSIRDGKVSIKESWVDIDNNNLVIKGMHIANYSKVFNYQIEDEKRTRQLLAHKNEIRALANKTVLQGYTIVPLQIFLSNRGKCKVTIGVAKGKHNYDKRNSIKERDSKRDIERALRRQV